MEKVGKIEFVYLWITGLGGSRIFTRCGLVSKIFSFFFYHVLTDLHTWFITYLVINRNCFLFLHDKFGNCDILTTRKILFKRKLIQKKERKKKSCLPLLINMNATTGCKPLERVTVMSSKSVPHLDATTDGVKRMRTVRLQEFPDWGERNHITADDRELKCHRSHSPIHCARGFFNQPH